MAGQPKARAKRAAKAANPTDPNYRNKPRPKVKGRVLEKIDVKIGRPTSYQESFDLLVKRLSMLGLTDAQVAEVIGVTPQVLLDWDKRHPSFRQARTSGKLLVDVEVAESLHKRATGFTFDSEKIFLGPGGAVIRAETKEYVIPDTKAAEVWLYNRRPDQWKPRRPAEDPTDPNAPRRVEVTGGLPDDAV